MHMCTGQVYLRDAGLLLQDDENVLILIVMVVAQLSKHTKSVSSAMWVDSMEHEL